MRYRLAFDIGTNSIGWAMVSLDDQTPPHPTGLIRLGSRIYADGRNPKDGASLAVQRRLPRQTRRTRDRYLRRRERFMLALIETGLMPAEASAQKALVPLNPYHLRSKGLDEALTPHELGRALFHLNQRRGFKSNRKTDRSAAKDAGKIKHAIKNFSSAVTDAKTVGKALAQRLNAGQTVRARLIGSGKDEHYEFYIDRQWIADEFDALWTHQQRFHPALLTETTRERLKGILLHQRRLRPVKPGKCFLEPDNPQGRAPAALPSAQQFRLYQELNHLRVTPLVDRSLRPLNREERDALAKTLLTSPKKGFKILRKTLFGANGEAFRFSLESESRKELKGCDTAYKLAHKNAFGPVWHTIAPEKQDEIVTLLLNAENEDALADTLIRDHSLNEHQAQHVATLNLEDGYARFSLNAIRKMLPHLKEGANQEDGALLTYDKAVIAAGYRSHTALAPEEQLPRLPYYGQILWRYTQETPFAQNPDEREWGKIANPSVHAGLNQLRKLTNALIEKYGPPAQIVVELARELKSGQKEKERIRQAQAENKKRNDHLRARLQELNQPDNASNRLRLKLFEELEKPGSRCVYSGRQISLALLFSNAFHIDHILPFSRTLDDSYHNKLLVSHTANQYKGQHTPFEAFGSSPDGYDWQQILSRAAGLPEVKLKRFDPDAYENWLRDEDDFLARQLNDTAYLARCTHQYLSAICPANKVYSSPGRLTSLLRNRWGFTKDRNDHRHHALDAAIIAVTDRSLLQRVATRAAQAEAAGEARLLAGIEPPWPGYHHDVTAALQRCLVSHKPEHGPEGALHDATAYGIESLAAEGEKHHLLRYRKALTELKPGDEARIRCEPPLQQPLLAALQISDPKARQSALAALAEQYGQRKVRYIQPMSAASTLLIQPRSKDGKPLPNTPPYKAYKGNANYCYEIFFDPERQRWEGVLITRFQANRAAYRAFRQMPTRYRHQTATGKPLLMRLCTNDMLAIEENGQRRIMRVVQLTEGQIVLAEHFEGGALKKRNANPADAFSYSYCALSTLRALKARRVFVTLLGQLRDPGFRDSPP